MTTRGGGPLSGLVVLEMAGIGPVPFCAMLLADLGAEIIRIDRVAGAAGALPDAMLQLVAHGRKSIGVDVKVPQGRELVARIAADADVLLEGFRPGVMERLGLGPEDMLEANPRLVYGRMTGWGQDGPYAAMAGHDINYIGIAGALHPIGSERPVPPLNLIGDYGGGSLYLAVGVLAALLERTTSGRGQVVDTAIVDGAASLMTIIYQLHAAGFWVDRREANLLDGAAPFYRTYETADGRFVAVGALEPQFYTQLLDGLGFADEDPAEQMDRSTWPARSRRFADRFRSKTRDEWCSVFDGTDACVTPVLSLGEAPEHEHNLARRTFVERNEAVIPAPAPRFSRSRGIPVRPNTVTGSHSEELLERFGYAPDEIDALRSAGIVA